MLPYPNDADYSDISGNHRAVVRPTPLSDTTGAASRDPGTGLSAGGVAAVFAGAAAVVLVAFLVALRLLVRVRRGAPSARSVPERTPTAGAPTDELAAQATAALVETDDAVRTSEQELGFATARLGEHAAEPFSSAVCEARAELAAAIRLRQLLDDGTTGDERTRRSYLIQITEHCARASEALDKQAEAFDQLQDLAERAPELAAEVDAHVAQLSARLEAARRILAKLAERYTPDAIAAVAANPNEAAGRLNFAGTMLASARLLIADGRPGEAAILLQAAESSADQSTDLLDGIEHAEAELTQAASALPAALREIDAEIQAATDLVAARSEQSHAGRRGNGHTRRRDDSRAGPADDGHDGLIADARAVAADVRAQQAAGRFDALAALRDVQQADSALDHILASSRDDRDRRERARAVLDQAMLVARSSVTVAADFITTRRGGVGAEARTRLAEAQRHFRQAIDDAQADPEAAVAEAQCADALALQARSAAEADVTSFSYPQVGSASHDGVLAVLDNAVLDNAGLANTGLANTGLDSALLGGILIDTVPDEERAGGDAGELRVLVPASFGARLTRRRRGAGTRVAAASDASANRGRQHV